MALRRVRILGASLAFACSAAVLGQTATARDGDLLHARQEVWEAFFRNDQQALARLLPEETVAGDQGAAEWHNRTDVLRNAAEFVRNRGHLIRLEFSNVRIQRFGDVAIIYSNYALLAEIGGHRFRASGKAMELFVFRNGSWVNPGWEMDQETVASSNSVSSGSSVGLANSKR